MKRFSEPNRAFRFCLIVSCAVFAGALVAAQGSAALAADDMREEGPSSVVRIAVTLRGGDLAPPAVPFPQAAQQRLSGVEPAFMLPRTLRSPGRVQTRSARVVTPRPKPARSAGLATGHLTGKGRSDAGRQAAGLSFFGTKAIRFSNIASAKDWNRVKHQRIGGTGGGTEGGTGPAFCATDDCRERAVVLAGFSRSADKGSFFAKLEKANRIVNQNIKYREDQVTYKRLDYWATADETVRNGAGDCEDFAILKYALLLEAGVPASSMSLVVLKDLKRDLFHAVLAVSTNKGHFILDNVASRVYLDKEVPHYRPMFSFSTDRSWIHGLPTDAAPQRVSSLAQVAPGTDRSASELPLSRGDWSEIYPVERF